MQIKLAPSSIVANIPSQSISKQAERLSPTDQEGLAFFHFSVRISILWHTVLQITGKAGNTVPSCNPVLQMKAEQ